MNTGPFTEELYRLPKGDGDQCFFADGITLRRTTADWFPGLIDGFGDAILFIVADGAYLGQYVALTSRTTLSTSNQIANAGLASVVVHLIKNPTRSFGALRNDFDPIGMTFAERVESI